MLEVLQPTAGERILEVGPGAGYYAIPVAQRVGPTGMLTVVDIDDDMLATTVRRLDKRGLGDRVEALRADAASLPLGDDSFHAALLVAVLGEVGDRRGTLRELHRVLGPGGRLVIGEVRIDPHAIPVDRLRDETASAGFSLDSQVAGRLGYGARFVRPSTTGQR